MATKDPLFEFMPYGAPELRQAAPGLQARSLLLSVTLALMVFAGVAVFQVVSPRALRSPGDKSTPAVDVIYTAPPAFEVPPPPLVLRVSPRPEVTAVDGLVVPVADELVPPDVEIAPSGGSEGISPAGTGGSGEIGPDTPTGGPPADDVPPEWGAIVYTDVEPHVVVSPKPVYPDIGRDAGIEGKVVVGILVGKDGRVKDVRVAHSNASPILERAALEACRRWVFTPASVNGHPVMVWVSVPFDFNLH